MQSSRVNRVPSCVVMLLCVAGGANAAGGTAHRDIDASAAALPMLSSVAAREQTADQQVPHAINRLTFGARPGDTERVRAMGVDRWIAQQLEPSQTATGHDAAIAARYPVLGMSIRTLLREYPPNPVLRRMLRQGGATGQLANRLRDAGDGVAALVADLDDRMQDVVILTMTEFGRTARQNGNGGTDHGHAGSMFVIGGDVRGRTVHGRWPGLAPELLHDGRDLALPTDLRAVFGEIVGTHLGGRDATRIFPHYGGTTADWLRLLHHTPASGAALRRG